MALPTKPLDRARPFRRIHNDSFLVTDKPTWSGVDCGCHTAKDLPDKLEDGLRDYIKNNVRVLGPLLTVFDAVKHVTDAIGSLLQGTSEILRLIPILGQAANIFLDIAKVFNSIANIIAEVLHEFVVDIGAELAKRAVRQIPQWVPVNKDSIRAGIRDDQIVEVEGIAMWSYGDPVGVPFSQWRTWLNWSIQVQPEEAYQNLVLADIATDQDSIKARGTPVAQAGTFDIQWDVGALNGPRDVSDYRDGFDEGATAREDGPMTGENNNWIWPAAGMYVWASGRWVFDCNRVDDVTASQPKTCAIMNPPRALATAVWGAVEFDQNPLLPNSQLRGSVPSIQFMFIACRRGGYIDYDDHTFTDVDYEFILDLPPLEGDFPPFPIDYSPNIDHNKIVLRPRLLQKVEGLIGGDSIKIEPVVKVLPAETPGKPPTQVLVTIPAKAIGRTTASAGFILSLGWHDPTRVRAAEVKRCAVRMTGVNVKQDRDNSVKEFRERFAGVEQRLRSEIKKRIEKLTIFGYGLNDLPTLENRKPANLPEQVYEAGSKVKQFIDQAIDKALLTFEDLLQGIMGGAESDEWLLRIGVNGRWRSVYMNDVVKGARDLPGPALFWNLDLGPDDPLFITAGGVEVNAVGGMMRDSLRDRMLELRHTPIDLDKICFPDPDLTDLVFEYAVQTLVGNSKRPLAFGSENTALGLIDPQGEGGQDFGRSNPLIVKTIEPREDDVQLSAPFARTVPTEYGVYQTVDPDYDLKYRLKIDDLIRK